MIAETTTESETKESETKRKTLHEISALYLGVWERIDEESEDGEIPFDLKLCLDAVQGELTERWEEVAKMIAECEREKAGIDEEVKRLKARADQSGRKAEQLRGYLKASMEAAGHKKHKGKLHTLTVTQNPPAVDIFSEEAIPDRFCTTVMTLKISKTAIAAEIKEKLAEAEASGEAVNPDEIVPGARLVSGSTLRIK